MTGFIPKINADYMAIATAPRSKSRKAIADRKRWDVKDLQEVHRRILRLKYQGLKNTEIALKCGLTEATISLVVNSQLGREHLAKMHEAADTKMILTEREIADAAVEAHRLLKSVMQADPGYEADIKTRVSVAESYLGRAGFAPVARNQQVSPSHFSQKELDDAKERAAEAKKELAPVEGQTVPPSNIVPLKASTDGP